MAKDKKWRHQEIDENYPDGFYAHKDKCLNCGEDIYIWIIKGNPIKDIMPNVECANCGVFQK